MRKQLALIKIYTEGEQLAASAILTDNIMTATCNLSSCFFFPASTRKKLLFCETFKSIRQQEADVEQFVWRKTGDRKAARFIHGKS